MGLLGPATELGQGLEERADPVRGQVAALGQPERGEAEELLRVELLEATQVPELESAQATLRAAPNVVRTPLVPWPAAAAAASALPAGLDHLWLKLESLQTTGSFKVRGMTYKISRSDPAALRDRGVVTMSAGNAGKAVAYLAREGGFGAHGWTTASAVGAEHAGEVSTAHRAFADLYESGGKR